MLHPLLCNQEGCDLKLLLLVSYILLLFNLVIFSRFRCTRCGRSWPSNKAMVVFHMQLIGGQGTVKMRRMRQNCKKCSAAPMEIPSITSENIDILLENLVEKIREKCYHEDLGRGNKPFVNLEVKSPHEPAHCEACIQGICTRGSASLASAFLNLRI